MHFLLMPLIFAGDAQPEYALCYNTKDEKKGCRSRRARRIQRQRKQQKQERNQVPLHCNCRNRPSGQPENRTANDGKRLLADFCRQTAK